MIESKLLNERSAFKCGYNGAMGVLGAIVTVVLCILAIPFVFVAFGLVACALMGLMGLVEKGVRPDKMLDQLPAQVVVVEEKVVKLEKIVPKPAPPINLDWLAVRHVGATDSTPQLRQWVNRNGERMIEARFVCYGFGEVKLRKPDLIIVKLPFKQLSDADQKYVKDRRYRR